MSESLWFVSLLVLAGIVCWAVDRDRMRWKKNAENAQRLLTNERASRESMEHQLNVWILRAGDEEAHRVLGILFPERRRVGGGKVQ